MVPAIVLKASLVEEASPDFLAVARDEFPKLGLGNDAAEGELALEAVLVGLVSSAFKFPR
jgi:hypothetical protein